MPDLTVSILLSEAFSNMVLACLLEPLRVVRDSGQADVHWAILTGDNGPVTSSSGIRVEPDRAIRDIEKSDLVLVVGGDNFRAEAQRRDMLRRVTPLFRSGVVIGAASAPWLLASLGLLDGRRATVHWQMTEEFAETFLGVEVSNARFERDDRFWTCGSAATALDLVLLFIEERFGPAVAYDASAMFLHADTKAVSGAPLPHLNSRKSEAVERLVSHMAETLETPLKLADLAHVANMSERSLSRVFRRELGVSPGRYYQILRLARARDLAANTRLSIEEIALRCGFGSSSGLRKAFFRFYGVSVRSFRRLN
ncbi:GlxA family transcriptional regulator [Pelagimonas sp. KU-00592-HH]|uniref:GlxA family transcriptional regulator n=1 Tax=Pelagimonas sp. KU-00592-HH TaxID=3127651 RepID=UPI0031045AD7